MAFDAELAQRLRAAIGTNEGMSEKRMMGGVCFFRRGNMIGGADRSKEGVRRFMFRVGKANVDAAARLGATGPLQLGGRTMPGFYFVDADRCDAALLDAWLSLAMAHANELPAK